MSTPLLKSIENEDFSLAEKLIKENQFDSAFLDKKDFTGITALMLATFINNIELVKLLIEAKADINIKDSQGSTSVIIGSQNNSTQSVLYLIQQHETDLDYKDGNGKGIEDWAKINKNVEILRKVSYRRLRGY